MEAIMIHAMSPNTTNAVRQSKLETRYVANGARIMAPNPPPDEVMPTAKPRFLLNHLEVVEFTTVYMGPVPNDRSKPYVKYNCHAALAWLVSSRLRPVNDAMTNATFRGPYLSKAQPPIMESRPQNNMYAEKIPEVAPRLTPNSPSMDFKNTPKE
jgi:hypothetical protein